MQQARIAQILHILKKKSSAGLILGQLLGDEFWVLGIFYLIRVFLYAWGPSLSLISQFMYINYMIYGRPLFLLCKGLESE